MDMFTNSPVTLKQLRILLSIAETESFSATANAVGLTQSAVSQAIKALDENLGISLIERTSRQVSLSADGRELIGPLREALFNLDLVIERARQKGSVARGTLTVACGSTVTGRDFAGRLAFAQQSYPDIRLQLRDLTHTSVIDAVHSGSAELGICVDDSIPSDLHAELLLHDDYSVFCCVDHPFSRRSEIPVGLLKYETLVLLSSNSGGRASLDSFLARYGINPAVAQEVAQPAMAMSLASERFGVAVLPTSCGDAAPNPRVCRVKISPQLDRCVSIVTRQAVNLSEAARLVKDALTRRHRKASSDSGITLIVPFPPNGPADRYARYFAQVFSEKIERRVSVDNAVGLGGLLGVHKITRSSPDGLTIGLAGTGATVFSCLGNGDDLFDVFCDVTYLHGLVKVPNILLVGAHVAAWRLTDLIAQARMRPGKYQIAHVGQGSLSVLADLFQKKTDLLLNARNYEGLVPAMTDLMKQRVDIVFAEAAGAMSAIRNEVVRPLMVAGHQRASWLPDTPTCEECGLPDVFADGGYCLVAPTGLKEDIRHGLTRAIVETLESPAIERDFMSLGGTPDDRTGEMYVEYLKSEHARWRTLDI